MSSGYLSLLKRKVKMNRSKRNKLINNFILASFILGLVTMVSCETYDYVSPQEYIDREMKLLDDFYTAIIDTVDNVERSWIEKSTAEAVDTVDNRNGSGMLLFHTKIGEGDSVKLYKRVSYRYIEYQILTYTDSVTNEEIPGMYLYSSNEYAEAPVSYTTFPKNDATSAYNARIPQGVNEAILNMRYGGECRVVIPSSINSNSSYITTIFDLRVTYLEN